jgi:hypothetical protein
MEGEQVAQPSLGANNAHASLSSFLQVRKALNLIQHGVVLGTIYSTVGVWSIDEDYYSSQEEGTTDHLFPTTREEQKRKEKRKREEQEASGERIDTSKKAIESAMNKIATCLARLKDSSSFWCGGSMVPAEDIPLTFRVVDESQLSGPKVEIGCGSLMQPDVETILKRVAQPAPFGDLKTHTTVIDDSVRKAWECSLHPLKDRPYVVLKKVHTHIKEAFQKENFHLAPYKLNVYCEGGFFKPHVDTPVHARTSIGTLVICLPSSFEGGEFVVSYSGQTHVFDWGKRSAEGILQWAAFYNDCLHEVKPVTAGNRVTLTYTIESGGAYTYYDPATDDAIKLDEWEKGQSRNSFFSTEDWRSKLKAAITQFPETQLGLLLSHKYTQIGLNRDNFKGVDQLVWNAISNRTGWMYTLMPVVFRFHAEREYEEDEISRDREVYAFSQEDIDYLSSLPARRRVRSGFSVDDVRETNINKPNHGLKTPIPFLLVSRGEILDYDHQDDSDGSRTGNVAPETTDALYYHAALIVHKPPVGKVCSLFRMCKAVLSWHPELVASSTVDLPDEVIERLKRKHEAREEEEEKEGEPTEEDA